MKDRTTEPARAKGLQPGVHPSGEGCGLALKGQVPVPGRDQAEVLFRMLGSVANAVVRRNVTERLPGGEPCDREGHARFWEGVLETQLSPWRRVEPLGRKRQEWQPGLKAQPPRQRPTPHRIWRSDVLWEAWERVRVNRGAAGVDRETLADVEAYGVERMLQELQRALRTNTYRPSPVRRRGIPKPDGGVRPLGIPTVRDRVAQQAAKLALEPLFEADFLPCSHGYRPRRSATRALEVLRVGFIRGQAWVLECDLRGYFDSIDHVRLLAAVERRVSDRRVLKLVRQWLKAGVMEEGVHRETVTGTPQGGVISPLLANIHLHALDEAWRWRGQGELVRYADDFVVMCRSREEAEAALELVREVLAELGLELHPDKTRIVDLREGREGFDFLGCHFRGRVSGRQLERGIRRYYLHRWPTAGSMKRVREKIRARTGRNRCGTDIRVVISELNPILRGWGNYHRTGNAASKFVQLDDYVVRRLQGLMRKRHGRNLRFGVFETWTRDWFDSHGLYRLCGTIRYPEAA